MVIDSNGNITKQTERIFGYSGGKIRFYAAASASGTIQFFARYRSLSNDGSITAAT